MSSGSYVLIPLLVAFLVSIATFYIRESARTMISPSFGLALLCLILLLGFLGLRVTDAVMPPYSGEVLGVVGLGLLGAAIALFRYR